ncbi:MAG TPA: hypothetical protein VGW96_06600, partial [Candidatus Eremiobacteraceae bacterium]|nr:hypothetical protein [Candidatus Eremiobacteraceae bacterium]
MPRSAVVLASLITLSVLAVACASWLRGPANGPAVAPEVVPAVDQAAVNATATIPPGPQGALIAYGRDILEQTP